MIVLNELTTPLGIALVLSAMIVAAWENATYAANTEMKISSAFGSKKAPIACFTTNSLFLIPVSFPATRLTAMMRSRSLRKRALEGASGRTK